MDPLAAIVQTDMRNAPITVNHAHNSTSQQLAVGDNSLRKEDSNIMEAAATGAAGMVYKPRGKNK